MMMMMVTTTFIALMKILLIKMMFFVMTMAMLMMVVRQIFLHTGGVDVDDCDERNLFFIQVLEWMTCLLSCKLGTTSLLMW